jgi:hypothetical protein
MLTINEYDKVRLKTGEIARVVEILEAGVLYIAEIHRKGEGVSVEHVEHGEVFSVFKEIEHPMPVAG